MSNLKKCFLCVEKLALVPRRGRRRAARNLTLPLDTERLDLCLELAEFVKDE